MTINFVLMRLQELKRLIKGKWWTRTLTRTDSGGEARFRGFFGEYEVTTRVDGRKLTGTFQFDKSARDATEVRLIPDWLADSR